jgi:FKBP-type peptidyl-prolyl cis-trans isomerase 2
MFLQGNSKTILTRIHIAAVMSLFMTGCAATTQTRVIDRGDLVQVHYTCGLKDGGIVDTTDEKTALDPDQQKSKLFKPSGQGYRPVLMRAGGEVAGVARDERHRSLKGHIAVRLAERLLGLTTGETKTLELKSDLMPGLSQEDRFLTLARVWHYSKEEIVTRKHYEEAIGKAPEVGFQVPWREPFRAQVYEITDNFVKLNVSVPPDVDMETPFGLGKISDAGERWQVEVDAREGTLVRSGPLLGRIAEVGQDIFKVDFGYPFGNEPLFCDILAESAPEGEAGLIAQDATENTDQSGAFGRVGAIVTGTAEGDAAKGRLVRAEGAARETFIPPEKQEKGAGKTLKIEPGDLAEVHYTATLEDGTLVQTSIRHVAEDPAVIKALGYRAPEIFGPVEILAGERAVFPRLGRAVLGMAPGEKKTVPLIPDLAFGPKNPKKIETYDAVKRIPRVGFVAARDYLQRFGTFPIKGKEVQFTPYFKSRVIDVTDDHVKLEALARDGARVKNEFGGFTEVRIEGDEVVLRLIPEIGARFNMEDKKGVITAHDEKTFTVDYNPPLAGKPVVLEVEVLSFTKASTLEALKIEWLENHDKALERAEAEKKPVLLVLYAAWCSWSKKLMNESLEDPRIKALKDRFVWVKVDSQKHKDLYEFYEQKGFPLTVLLNPEGEVIKKISGYSEAGTLKKALEAALARRVAKIN